MAWYHQMAEELAAEFSRQNFSALQRWARQDLVVDFSRSINDIRGVYVDLDEMEAAFRRFFEAWQSVTWEITDATPVDERHVLALTRISGVGKGSGIEIEARGAQIWEHRDEKLVRVTMFQTGEDAEAFLAGEAETP